jgi:basic amino acid/polyamine antiporter, APA family
VGHDGIATLISVGVVVGLTTVMLILLLGQSRVFFAMSRDRLLPPAFAKVHPRFGTPVRTSVFTGIAVALLATFVPLTELAELVNIGTLFAFLLVNIGVIVLRRTMPDMERPFRTPLVPLFPLIGTGLCIWLMTKLQAATWWRFGIWLALGLVIYFAYSRRHSRVQGRGDGDGGLPSDRDDRLGPRVGGPRARATR